MEIKELLLEKQVVINNEYLQMYEDLVLKNSTQLGTSFTQKHHVIPVCLYKTDEKITKKALRILADKDPKNLTVNLSASDHILAHYYLFKCASTDAFKYANAAALKYLKETFKLSQYKEIDLLQIDSVKNILRHYDSIYKEYILYMKKIGHNNHSTAGKIWINNGVVEQFIAKENLDYKLSEQWQLGRLPKSEETKNKISNTLKIQYKQGKIKTNLKNNNTIWMHNKEKEIQVSRNEIDEYLAIGYVVGRLAFSEKTKQKLKESHTGLLGNVAGRKKINNGKIMKTVKVDELETYLANGWTLGELPKSSEWLNKIKQAKERG